MEKKILVVAGEASGDAHAANLILELKKSAPHLSFFGLGGQKMKAAGVDIVADPTALAVVGFFEVFRHYSYFKNIFRLIVEKARQVKPDAAILVDYPGFNLRLALRLKRMGVRVIYFISPQVWAWGRKRIVTIKKNVDLMLVLFKFEEILYKDGCFNVKFVGHPLLDAIKNSLSREQLLDSIGFKRDGTTIALLPGSREREVQNHLPVMLAAAQKLYVKSRATQFLICRCRTLPRELFKKIFDKTRIDFPYKILDDQTYDGVAASSLAIVASGTATLETAILNTPMVIVYRVSLATWLLAKMLVTIPYIGLVNIVAGEKIVPELVQFDATPQKISQAAWEILQDKKRMEKIHAELYALKNTLGIPGAYGRAAGEIVKFLAL